MGRMQYLYPFATVLALAAKEAGAFTIGSPSGLGAGTTGGAGGEVVYPTTNAELLTYLNDTRPFIIVLNKTFDFRGTEGTTTEIGCRPVENLMCMEKNNGFKGQDMILRKGKNITSDCADGTEVMVTYDNAALNRALVRDNKTIRGIGKKGVMIGKGLTLRNNIIVQNIFITELNPSLNWAGDAIFIPGSIDGTVVGYNIWIDHVKVSRIGRQMVVTNKAGVSSMTISNSDFDGHTDFSSSCDGHHSWTFLLSGKSTGITMINNYVHGTSGRSPRVGGEKDNKVVVHIVNNYWGDSTGHSLDVAENAHVLAEGNYFENTNQTLKNGTEGCLYVFNSTVGPDMCKSYLGRSCAPNVLVHSSSLTERNGACALEAMKGYPNIIDFSSKSARAADIDQKRGKQSSSEADKLYCGMTPLPVPASELVGEWARTTGNYGVGNLD
uniref:pectin lyase n=1 Tax=Peronospora matthiolae TaxID=2874970 RepID=A0AAV1UP76_9STRA